MSNSYNKNGRFWVLDTSDILHSPAEGGLWIRKIQLIVATEANSATFYMIPSIDSTTDHDNGFTNLTFAADRITDAAGDGIWDSTAAGDWMYISDCSTAANDGWWLIETDSTTDVQILENDVNIGGTHTLTVATTASARVRTYSPETCVIIRSNKIGNTGSLAHPTLDWGDKGRWFPNLGVAITASDYVYVYLR